MVEYIQTKTKFQLMDSKEQMFLFKHYKNIKDKYCGIEYVKLLVESMYNINFELIASKPKLGMIHTDKGSHEQSNTYEGIYFFVDKNSKVDKTNESKKQFIEKDLIVDGFTVL